MREFDDRAAVEKLASGQRIIGSLSRYDEFVRQLVPAFTRDDWSDIVQANWSRVDDDGDVDAQSISANVADTDSIDSELAVAVSKLTDCELLAIFEVVLQCREGRKLEETIAKIEDDHHP